MPIIYFLFVAGKNSFTSFLLSSEIDLRITHVHRRSVTYILMHVIECVYIKFHSTGRLSYFFCFCFKCDCYWLSDLGLNGTMSRPAFLQTNIGNKLFFWQGFNQNAQICLYNSGQQVHSCKRRIVN